MSHTHGPQSSLKLTPNKINLRKSKAVKLFKNSFLPNKVINRKQYIYLKNSSIFLAVSFRNQTYKILLKLFKDNKQISSHEIPGCNYILYRGAVFVKKLNSYFLFVGNKMFRKDVDCQTPYLYMELPQFKSKFEIIRHADHLKTSVIALNSERMFIIDLMIKKVVKAHEHGASFKQFFNSCKLLFHGRQNPNSAFLLINSDFYLVKLHGSTEKLSGNLGKSESCLWAKVESEVSNSNKTSIIGSGSDTHQLVVYEFSGSACQRKASLSLRDTQIGRKAPSNMIFVCEDQGMSLFLLFFEYEKKDAVPLVYDSTKNTLRLVSLKSLKTGFCYPIDVKRWGSEFKVLDRSLKLTTLSISS